MRARLLGSLGVVVTLVAAVLVAVPGLADPLSAVVSVVESRSSERLLLVLGSVVGLYAAWAARAGSPDAPALDGPARRFESAPDTAEPLDPPETVSAADRTLTGQSLDERIEMACEGDDPAFRAVRTDLARTAASAYARTADLEPAEARREILSGRWTDDPIASAVLADESGPDFPLVARLRAWLDPETERRQRIERTVTAVEAIFRGSGDTGRATADEEDDR